MTSTIMFDLDDTLLENSMEQFLPSYFKILGDHLNQYYPAEQLPQLIYTATGKMLSNLNPACTLEECFNQYFYEKLNHKKETLEDTISDFYKNIFPQLQPLTNKFEAIPNLIQKFKNNNFLIAITTNPLFPKQAILHRLDWAGIPNSDYQFEIITSFEEFHFSKPHPEYIAETLAQIGWPDGPVMMVGNDWEADILPAEKLGIPTYFLSKTPSNKPILQHPLSTSGDHTGIFPWAEKVQKHSPSFECVHTPQAYSAILRSTPAALSILLKNIRDIESKTRPINEEWSIVEIISHLFDVDKEVNIPRLQELKSQREPFFTAVITDDWAETKNYQSNQLPAILEQFIHTRIKLINEILSLSEEDWKKIITHTIFGPTAVLEIIKFMAQHDRIHIQQIHKTLGNL